MFVGVSDEDEEEDDAKPGGEGEEGETRVMHDLFSMQ